MMTPDDIEAREFMAAMRGYDRDEVGAFLHAIADDMRRLQDELSQVQADLAEAHSRPVEVVTAEPDPVDVEAVLGSQVADILRSARGAAETLTIETEEACASMRADAERHAAQVRGEAARHADESRREADRVLLESRANAERMLAEARSKADDLLQEALLRQERIEVSNHSALAAFGEVERQMADLRQAFQASFDLTKPAIAALASPAGVTPITAAQSIQSA